MIFLHWLLSQIIRLVIPVDNGVNDDLDWVQVRQEVDNLHGMLNDPHCHQFLTVVPPMHHERVGEPLNNGALRLPESLHRVSSSGVGNKGSMFSRLNSNVVNKTDVCDLQDEITNCYL